LSRPAGADPLLPQDRREHRVAGQQPGLLLVQRLRAELLELLQRLRLGQGVFAAERPARLLGRPLHRLRLLLQDAQGGPLDGLVGFRQVVAPLLDLGRRIGQFFFPGLQGV
jgi:hypothetical protein